MKVAILGYGKEGQSSAKYFQKHGADVKIWEHITPAEIKTTDFSPYDIVMRSPALPPQGQDFSSQTKYFFDHCPAPIIGVTGTKGKGTTCSLIASVIRACGETVHLLGNIGTPALEALDNIQSSDVVIYEMSSFQLWDMHKSPHIAVVLRLEPDHLDVHKDYAEYVQAKANIAKHQVKDDYCIYFHNNPDSTKIAKSSHGTRIPYPVSGDRTDLMLALQHLAITGPHNAENAEAALNAAASYYDLTLAEFLTKYRKQIQKGLAEFHGLPHRLEFVRELHGIKFFDDNFATNLPSTRAAINSFRSHPTVLIAGGRDKTDNADLPDLAALFNRAKNLKRVVLIGESGHELATHYHSDKFVLAETLTEAVTTAYKIAMDMPDSIVVMSPAAASFDMFTSYYDRGEQYQQLVKELQ